MIDLFTHQKIVRRRRSSFLYGRRNVRILDTFSYFWRMIFEFVGAVFSGLWDIVRSNPLIPRIIGLSFLFLFVSGAALLVGFAIFSPEMPPGNTVATLKDLSAYYLTTENSRSQVAILDSEDDWAILSAFDGQEYGAGSQTQDRSRDIEYPIRPGETLSEIAYAFGMSYDFLAWYNNITNANRIRVGTVIIVPSLENISKAEPEYRQRQARQPRAKPAARIKDIKISYESRMNGDINGSGITAHFFILNAPEDIRSYEWDLGDGKRSFRKDPSYEYLMPKTYVVRLTALDSGGVIYKSNPLYIDIPHPASTEEYSTVKFITLSSPDEYFVINGTISAVTRYANVNEAPLDLSESDQFLTKVRFRKPGYYGLTIRTESGREQYYSIFVSPVATMHADVALENFNWYRTQFNTGTPSNCGPASASMAIGWGTSKYFPVSSVREAVGWQGDGGTSFEDLLNVIKNHGISASIAPLRSVQNIRDIIDSGSIAIILLHTGGLRSTRSDPAADLFGKYYNDSVGHYVILKGYSLNGEYFVIHDPIPSDWGANSFRYGDDISMIGRNRYYSAAEVLRSLRRQDMIVVNQKK
jgi:murein DD-endopeptidase MepM/ murein hydrolase activator NlpD